MRRKQPKPLSGIETLKLLICATTSIAANNLNPYQGLKQENSATPAHQGSRKQPKPLSGIETKPVLLVSE